MSKRVKMFMAVNAFNNTVVFTDERDRLPSETTSLHTVVLSPEELLGARLVVARLGFTVIMSVVGFLEEVEKDVEWKACGDWWNQKKEE